MNRYDFYPGDYLKATVHLTMTQDGAYRRLMDHYYSTEQPISDSEKFRVARAFTEEERKETQWVLDGFFDFDGSVYRHPQIERNIEKAMPRVEAARKNGRKGGRPRKHLDPDNPPVEEKPSGIPSSKPSKEPRRNPERKLPSPSPSPSPINSDPSDQSGQHPPKPSGFSDSDPPPKKPRRKAQKPIPADWAPIERHRTKAAERGVDCDLAAEKFQAHAESHDRRCADWDRAFDNWLLNERGAPSRPGPGAKLQTNFDPFERAQRLRQDEQSGGTS